MKKNIYALILSIFYLLMVVNVTKAQFVGKWNVQHLGAAAYKIIIPAYGEFMYYYANVADPSKNGSGMGNNLTEITIPYTYPLGAYTVYITPTGTTPFHRLMFNNTASNYPEHFLSVESWGAVEWSTMVSMFSGCTNMTISASAGNPNLSNVTDMSYMFYGVPNFGADISSWDVSNVTDMSHMFQNNTTYNQPLNNWDVSSVTNMSSMFEGCSQFNQSLNDWDVSSVTNMNRMFYSCSYFNGAIGDWDVSSVDSMNSMFAMLGPSFSFFNQPLGNWNVSNVKDMRDMFYSARVFNQNINNWDVSNVTTMSRMFSFAEAFNQPLNSWDVSNVTDMSHMFNKASAFNQPLNNWTVSNVVNMGSMFHRAWSFNQPLNNWDVSNVTVFGSMFSQAYAFNQPLNSWDVSSATDLSNMFNSASTFNHSLIDWDVSNATTLNGMFADAAAFNRPLHTWVFKNDAVATNFLSNSGIDCSNYSHSLTGWASNTLTGSNVNMSGNTGCSFSMTVMMDRTSLTTAKTWTLTGDILDPTCTMLPLSISFLHFSVQKQGAAVYLDWATGSEQNTLGFDVERSVDGKNWMKIGFVPAQYVDGNSNITLNYDYNDFPNALGKYFYRIKEIDRSGNANYSEVKTVIFNQEQTIIVFPNPTKDVLNIQGLAAQDIVHIVDAMGKTVATIIVDGATRSIDISKYPAGVYYLNVQHNQQIIYSSLFTKI